MTAGVPGPAAPVEEGPLAPERLREVLGHFCTGVTVVTALDGDGRPVGFSCQSFVSLSLEPPLVSFAVSRMSRSWPGIQYADRFCVNILSADQETLCRRFADRGADRFAGVEWWPGPATGSPRLAGALAWVDCTLDAVYPGGDHRIAVGRVRALGAAEEGTDPLLYFRSAFRTPAAVPAAVPAPARTP